MPLTVSFICSTSMLEGSLERKFGFHIFNSPWPGLGSWCNRDQIAEQVAASRRLSAAQHRRMQSIAEAMLLFGEKSFNFGALHDSPFEIIFRHLPKKSKTCVFCFAPRSSSNCSVCLWAPACSCYGICFQLAAECRPSSR